MSSDEIRWEEENKTRTFFATESERLDHTACAVPVKNAKTWEDENYERLRRYVRVLLESKEKSFFDGSSLCLYEANTTFSHLKPSNRFKAQHLLLHHHYDEDFPKDIRQVLRDVSGESRYRQCFGKKWRNPGMEESLHLASRSEFLHSRSLPCERILISKTTGCRRTVLHYFFASLSTPRTMLSTGKLREHSERTRLYSASSHSFS